MPKSDLRLTKKPVAAELNVQHRADHIPNVGGKMFHRTSESVGRTR